MKLAIALGLLLPGMLALGLAARAAGSNTGPRPVELGKRYQLSSETVIRGECPGCGSPSIPALHNAILRVKLVADGQEQEIRIAGDARFVAPVTGVLHIVDAEPPPEQLDAYRAECSGLKINGAEVNIFTVEEISP